MGYTKYELTCSGAPPDVEAANREVLGYWDCPVDQVSDHDACKWYNHDQDMLALSREHPRVTFLLKGVGEEEGDFWAKYYVNGRRATYRAPEWVPPPLNPEDLK